MQIVIVMGTETRNIGITHTAEVLIFLTGDTTDSNERYGNMSHAVEAALEKAGLGFERIRIGWSVKRIAALR